MRHEAAKKLILNALMKGQRITTLDANIIGKTTEGGRRIRELREHYPIMKEQVPGESYCRYFIPAEFIAEQKKPMGTKIGEFFDDLNDMLKGGLFEPKLV